MNNGVNKVNVTNSDVINALFIYILADLPFLVKEPHAHSSKTSQSHVLYFYSHLKHRECN